ncbi:MAG: DUF6886 family protein [Sphingomonadaceae bacterium]
MFAPDHLFHASEEHDIKAFHPRLPPAPEVGRVAPCVWAISHAFLSNYLAPRDCPRIIFGRGENTSAADAARFMTDSHARRIMVIERAWRARMEDTQLSLYAFTLGPHWQLFDANCGVHVSDLPVVPAARHRVNSPARLLGAHDTELREVDDLRPLARAVRESSLCFSIIRIRNAGPPAVPPAERR